MLLVHVEELDEAGVEEIVIVAQKTDLENIERLFLNELSPQNFALLNDHQKAYSRNLRRLGSKVVVVVQAIQDGMGHAVACAAQAMGEGDDPFLLVIAHHLNKSNTEVSCSRQVSEAYERLGRPIVGLRRTGAELVEKLGVVSGVMLDDSNTSLRVVTLVEKPTADYARKFLHTPSQDNDTFLTCFGIYALTPKVFAFLDSMLENNLR